MTSPPFIGYLLGERSAQLLQRRATAQPSYIAVDYSRVEQLLGALKVPDATTYAHCTLANVAGASASYIAVPFDALREDAQFSLAGVYLFRQATLNLPWMAYSIKPFTPEPEQGGASLYVQLTLSVAPPWSALPPAYVCCSDRVERIALLYQVYPQLDPLIPVMLQVDDRPPAARLYRAAPVRDLLPHAREHLARLHELFFCLYDARLRAHPLLIPHKDRLVECLLGQASV